ncbi:MAG: Tex-like N-terminal domain-containing protein, partial [Planctomycetota bacterium]
MTDLSGIARRLRLSDDQIRLAADLIQQGFHPSFIERYRSDESGGLTPDVLWALKLEIDRSQRLEAAKQRSQEQLPKDAVLDDEANKGLNRSGSETEVDVVMRAWRARRNLAQTAERDAQVQEFLEHLIAYEGETKPVAEIAQEKYSLGAEEAAQLVEQAQRLMGLILHCDARLNHSLRKIIQKKARVSIDYLETSNRPEKSDAKDAAETVDETASVSTESVDSAPETPGTEEPTTGEAPAESSVSETAEPAVAPVAAPEEEKHEDAAAESPAAETSEEEASSPAPESEAATTEVSSDASSEAGAESEASSFEPELTFTTPGEGKSKGDDSKKTESKSQSKLTPRQRRRRWLSTMLQPMKSLKESISKLTAYQLLMLGRGRRSQIVRVNLQYEKSELLAAARDTFVAESHKLASWFSTAVEGIWESGLQAKIEADVLSLLEENSQDKLLETATDQLRASLMRRPIRGHVILLVDTIGPKSSAVTVVGPDGRVLHTDEVICSAQPEAVNQNVAQLGEIIHRFQVTLVTLTNGPARRFLLLTVRELMKHSGGDLRWTMADRGGAEAYAAGRSALRELPAHNRRMRAAIWVARSQIDPLGELLKIDVNRIRLGSYQRELPQEPLRKLIRDTITQCVSHRGVDTHRADLESLQYVPGVEEGQAQQIATLASNRNLTTREKLVADVSDWPENQRRQAIGFLRLYGSEQKLDATLVHPEDYKLAERLVSNTELESPADAPEGWELPPFEPTVAAEPEAAPAAPAAETAAAEAASDSSEAPAPEADTAEVS